MTTEENKRLLALASIIADLKAENVELVQRVHQLISDYNEAVRQKTGLEKRKDEEQPKQTDEVMFQIHTLGDKQELEDGIKREYLELENEQLKQSLGTIDSFLIEKKLYKPQGTTCTGVVGHPAVGSLSCLGCSSCLRFLDGYGVVCRQTLEWELTKNNAYD